MSSSVCGDQSEDFNEWRTQELTPTIEVGVGGVESQGWTGLMEFSLALGAGGASLSPLLWLLFQIITDRESPEEKKRPRYQWSGLIVNAEKCWKLPSGRQKLK